MHQSLSLNINNNNINNSKTVNFDLKDIINNNNSINNNKNITYENHKVHRYCHDHMIHNP